MRQHEYFTISHYIPESLSQKQKDLAKYLRSAHYGKRGLDTMEAEQNFIRYMQELKEYGMHLYSAVWVSFVSVVKNFFGGKFCLKILKIS